mmetsp:Transcript_20078/g.40531  ORF Transcript_20078/g.40531 Transcript_20078/m.40531 type:complete len:287 (+) Transcript_20078:90-950(+)
MAKSLSSTPARVNSDIDPPGANAGVERVRSGSLDESEPAKGAPQQGKASPISKRKQTSTLQEPKPESVREDASAATSTSPHSVVDVKALRVHIASTGTDPTDPERKEEDKKVNLIGDSTRSKKGLHHSLSRRFIQTIRHIDDVPKDLWLSAIIVAINALLMAVTEILIEVLVLAGVYPKLPFRLDFFFLTMLSALLGWQTLDGIRQKHFDTSINALQVSGLVEAALITGDIVFMKSEQDKYPAAVPTRLPFAILTGINLILVAYMYVELWLYHREEDEKGASRWKL